MKNGEFPESLYIQALLADLVNELVRVNNRKVISIFIGGGTPSLVSATGIRDLLESIKSRVSVVPDCEITLEANPGSLEAGRFQGYRDAGVNRLSIGIQSFTNDQLIKLGRVHDCETACAAIEQAQAAGFDNINLDIMYALPGQSLKQALGDLDQARAFDTSHLSWYQLTIEPNTLFYSSPPQLPDTDASWDMQEHGVEFLQGNGFIQYEISAYSRTGRTCRHNLNYWQFGDYVGIGAGAHGKVTDEVNGQISRYSRHRAPQRYMKLAGDDNVIADHKILSKQDIKLEFMMNALRLTNGISKDTFEQHAGMSCSLLSEEIEQALECGFMLEDPGRFVTTPRGRQYLNDLLEIFMQDRQPA